MGSYPGGDSFGEDFGDGNSSSWELVLMGTLVAATCPEGNLPIF